MSRIMRICAFLSVLFFTGNVVAATGYTCAATGTYTSCNSGYYLSDCGTTASAWTGQNVTPTLGNTCNACPDGYDCAGGTKCPVFNGIACPAGKYLPAGSITCTTCPANSYCPGVTASGTSATSSDRGRTACTAPYSKSAAGATSEYSCYTTCQPGTAVFSYGESCTTQEGAWYTDTAHDVYFGDLSPLNYCPYDSISMPDAPLLHNARSVCRMAGEAGYSTTVYPKEVYQIRLISKDAETAIPLAEIQAYNNGVQLPVRYMGGAYGNTQAAIDGNLAANSYAIIPPTNYAGFGVDDSVTEIRLGLGTMTVSRNLLVQTSEDGTTWETVFDGAVLGKNSAAISVNPLAVMQSILINDIFYTPCPAGHYRAAGSISSVENTSCTGVVSAGYYNTGCGTNATGGVCIASYSGGQVSAGYYNTGCGTNATGGVCSSSYSGGKVSAGYYSSGGGTSATPTAAENGCLTGQTCGMCTAGRYCPEGSANQIACPGYTGNTGTSVVCDGEAACKNTTGKSYHRTTFPEYYHADDNLVLIKTWFPTSANKGNKAITDCRLSYTYKNDRGSFSQDASRYRESTGKYDTDGSIYYYILNPGYYGSVKLRDDYCTNIGSKMLYQNSLPCPAGKYCPGYTQESMPQCNSGTYNDTVGIIGAVSAGYYSTGGAASATPTPTDCYGKQADGTANACGLIAGGYYGAAGATVSTGSGKVSAGYYSSGGGTSATPTAAGNGCLTGQTCGKCGAETYATAGASKCENCPAADDTTTRTTFPAKYYANEGTLTRTYMKLTPYKTGITSKAGCAVNYRYNGPRGSFYHDGVKYNEATGKYDVEGGDFYYLSSKAGYYLDTRYSSNYCSIGTAALYRNSLPCPAGQYCPGAPYTTCSSLGTDDEGNLKYYDTMGITGYVAAGYYSTGGAKKANPASTDCVGVQANGNPNTCGQVDGGYYSDGGATSATPTGFDNGCVGQWNNNGTMTNYVCGACPAQYDDDTSKGKSNINQCKISVPAGNYLATKNGTTFTPCTGATYKTAHLVPYGSTSTCDACPTATKYADKVVSYHSGRTSRSTCSAKFKEEVANGETTYFNCYLFSGDDYGTLEEGKNCWTYGNNTKCNAGYYSPVVPNTYDEMWYTNLESVVNDICQPVESGYWSGADSLTRTACETGLVTCGAGLCANEAGDCGRKLHANDKVIYLRSKKRTNPSLTFKIGDKEFYGNLVDVVADSLRVKNGTKNYSVVNDNQ